MSFPTLSRRDFVHGAAGTAAGLASGLTLPVTAAADDDDSEAREAWRTPPPKPIPGGFQVPGGPLFHVFGPGDPSITLPFSHNPLGGFDVDPTTITDFDGVSAVAFHVGTATARDGTKYNLETDTRAFKGTYVDGTGTRRFGTFAFI
jgi:hypothetical protein